MPSFFKKPSWAQTDAPAKSTEFYRRSEQVYSDIVATESKSNGHREHREASTTSNGPRKIKRRRLSSKDENSDVEVRKASPPSQSTTGKEEVTEANAVTPPPSRLSPQPPNSPKPDPTLNNNTPSKSRASPNIEQVTTASVSPKPIAIIDSESASENDGDDESDEEYAELARRARERARNRSARKSPADKKEHDKLDENKHTTRRYSNGDTNEGRAEEPVVTILIMSNMENTKPLLVRRKLSQNLGDVRKAWCDRQGFSSEMTSSVCLTWKGRRLFDVTTCKSLGIKDTEDTVFSSEGVFSDGDGTEGIHMEAMTLEMFEEQRRRTAMASFGDTGEQDEDSDLQEQKQPEETLNLILKNPDLDDFKIKVRPTTQLIKVVTSFRNVRKIPEEKTVLLLFDGDRLDPNSTVKDNDMADLDCVDAIIK